MKIGWKVLLGIVGFLIIVIILIWPMAPVWQNLGLKPVCVQGDWPNFKITYCPDQSEETILSVPMPTIPANGPIPIIVDDDGSPDGMAALMYFLQNPAFDIRAVTISYGEAHPEIFSLHIAQILTAYGRSDIPVGYGRDTPLQGNNAFPDPWRQGSDKFWNITLPTAESPVIPVSAPELIVETVNYSDQPVVLFVSGAHTNLAQALRLNPDIVENIRDVFIMGGSINIPGNIHSDWPEFDNTTAEWNIWVDPLAASEVFNSGLNLHLVPLDATRQVTWAKGDAAKWRNGASPEADLAAELVQMMLDVYGVKSVYVWDLVTAAQTTMPEICPEVPMGLEVVTAAGTNQGRTQIVDRTPNVSVCLEPDAMKVKGLVQTVFQMQ